jgi:hypothetical protein
MNLSSFLKTLEDIAGSADSKGRVKSEGASSGCGTWKDRVKEGLIKLRTRNTG